MPFISTLRRPSGIVPTVIALIALVVAGSGTAVAVAATQVNIVDRTNTANTAKVDGNGRLATSTPLTTFATVNYLFAGAPRPYPLTSPTSATLALTDLTYDNGYNRTLPNTNYVARLVKIDVGSGKTCTDADATFTDVRQDAVPAGTSTYRSFSTPLTFRPTGSKKYCLGFQVNYVDPRPNSEYALTISMAGFTASGSFTPAAKAASTARPEARRNR